MVRRISHGDTLCRLPGRSADRDRTGPRQQPARALHAELVPCAGEVDSALCSPKVGRSRREGTGKPPVLAKVLAASGDYPQAIVQLQSVVDSSQDATNHVGPRRRALGRLRGGLRRTRLPNGHQASSTGRQIGRTGRRRPEAAALRGEAGDDRRQSRRGLRHWLGTLAAQGQGRAAMGSSASAIVDELGADDMAASELRLHVCEQAVAALAGVVTPRRHQMDRRPHASGQKDGYEAFDPSYKRMWPGSSASRSRTPSKSRLPITPATKHWCLGKRRLPIAQGDLAGKQLPSHDYVRGSRAIGSARCLPSSAASTSKASSGTTAPCRYWKAPFPPPRSIAAAKASCS